MPVTIELYPHEVTTILQALAELPYKESAALIRRIVAQTSTKEEDEHHGDPILPELQRQ